MRLARIVLPTAVLAVSGTGAALASGGPPATTPPDPAPFTVAAVGVTARPVVAPARRSDATIERAVRAARARAMPTAVAAARDEAAGLARAAGLTLGAPLGLRRETSPAYYDGSEGRFGPGVWCGQIYSRRTVRRAGGTRRRVTRRRFGCKVPAKATLRVTVTFAATRP